MNEHKNTISQSNHSALVISFRIKKSATQEIFIICLFVCLFVFVGFCFCFGICFVLLLFFFSLFACLFVCLLVVKDRYEEVHLYGHGAF